MKSLNAGKSGINIQKPETQSLSLILYQDLNSTWFNHLNLRPDSLQLLEGKVGVHVSVSVGSGFLNRTPEAQETRKQPTTNVSSWNWKLLYKKGKYQLNADSAKTMGTHASGHSTSDGASPRRRCKELTMSNHQENNPVFFKRAAEEAETSF